MIKPINSGYAANTVTHQKHFPLSQTDTKHNEPIAKPADDIIEPDIVEISSECVNCSRVADEVSPVDTDTAEGTENIPAPENTKDTEENRESTGKVGINVGKLARKLAAAKTRSQVRAVIAEIKQDLQECEAGEKQGMDVDTASVQAAKQLLGTAKQSLGKAEDREPTPQEDAAFVLAGMM